MMEKLSRLRHMPSYFGRARGSFSAALQNQQPPQRQQRFFASSNIVEEELNAKDTAGGERTHFGKRIVTHDEKRRLVGEVFSSVAEQYDVMNDLMSGTLHRSWKDSFVSEIDPIAWPNMQT